MSRAGERTSRRHAGQSTVELAVMLGVVVTALAGMSLYVRRAYQGYLYANATAHGQQFDPTQPFSTEQKLTKFSQTQTVTIEAVGPGVRLPSGGTGLPRVPGGQLAGRAIKTKVDVTTNWEARREATYDAR